MAYRPLFYGDVVNGKLTLANQQRFLEYIKGLQGKVQITIEPERRQRSNNQNSYYWAVVVPILCAHFGYTAEEMHNALKWQFLRIMDAPIPKIKSSAALTTKEFEEFMERVRSWAAQEFNINIPLPNEIHVDPHEKW